MNHPPFNRPRFTFDKIRLVTNVSKRRLVQVLPLGQLRRHCRYFQVLDVRRGNPSFFRSAIEFGYSPATPFWNLLAKHEHDLGVYSIASIELAFDFPAKDERTARLMCLSLVPQLRKLWHRRKYIWSAFDDTKSPPPGIIAGPTFYFEDRKAQTALKAYCRYSKTRTGFNTNDPVVRLEWTLKNARAIKRKTGLVRVTDLVGFNPSNFLDRHFRLERINLHRLGAWLQPKSRRPDRRASLVQFDYDAEYRAASVFLRVRAHKDPQAEQDWQHTLVKWQSSSQLRGYLRNERARVRSKSRPRTKWDKKLSKLTDYKLAKFFDEVKIP